MNRNGREARGRARKTMTIELLALDLSSCRRCSDTASNLEAAVEAAAPILREAGVELVARKTVVATLARARRLRFQSSPTIRIDGRDIAQEVRESPCGDCGELCGCAGGCSPCEVGCRVWDWQGTEHLAAPKALILDAILRGYGGGFPPAPKDRYCVPESLRKVLSRSGA